MQPLNYSYTLVVTFVSVQRIMSTTQGAVDIPRLVEAFTASLSSLLIFFEAYTSVYGLVQSRAKILI